MTPPSSPPTSSTTTSSWPAPVRPRRAASSSSKPPCGAGVTPDTLAEATGVDPWFLDQLAIITAARARLEAMGSSGRGPASLDRGTWRAVKRLGFSDAQIAYVLATGLARTGPAAPTVTEAEVRQARLAAGVRATFKTVDTCGAEFEATTPYHYATYEDEDEVRPAATERVVILGSGPNRIGQGIEFDYCCVHASMALQAAGYETVMVNCNPETVSTDYDTSDRLYFEPITAEDVANVLDAEMAAGAGPGGAPVVGVIVSLGGQTPLKLAHSLPPELVLGTSPASIDLAEDRERWNDLCEHLGIPQPPGGIALSVTEALAVAHKVGYPVLVRPSYVLGGRAMEIVYDDDRLTRGGRGAGGVAGPGGGSHRRSPRSRRQVPRRRRRGRRRRVAGQGRRGVGRRDHGARRRGRGAFGGLGLRPAAPDPVR